MVDRHNKTNSDRSRFRIYFASLCVVIAVFSFPAAVHAQTTTPQTSKNSLLQSALTPEEQAWLAEHPEIVLGAATGYPPLVIKRADGTHVGMLVDFFEQVNRRFKTSIRLQIEDSWADVQKKRRKTGRLTVCPLAEEIRTGPLFTMQPMS